MRDEVALEVKDLSVAISGKTVLSNLNFKVNTQSFTVILGRNGVGKSTLTKAIVGLIPYKGEVKFASSWDSKRKGVAYLPQNLQVPTGMSVTEYILIGRTPYITWFGSPSAKDYEVIDQVMKKLDLKRYADRDVSSLSGGELQKVAIARAMAQQPKLLVLDEPVSALDIGQQKMVVELIEELHSDGLTVMMVLHDLNLARNCSEYALLLEDSDRFTYGLSETTLSVDNLNTAYKTRLREIIQGDCKVIV